MSFFAAILLLLTALLAPGEVSARPFAGLAEPIIKEGGAADGAAAWGDFDNDGDLDLLVTGIGNNAQRATILFENRNGVLEAYASGLPRVESSSADWGDFDNDGYLDVLLTGQVGYSNGQILGLAGVYRNVPNPANSAQRVFVLAHELPRIYSGAGVWGDYNNDGRMDILLTGYTDGGVPLTRLYSNDGIGAGGKFVFSDSGTALEGLGSSQAKWGDYNNDGFVDFVIMGRNASGSLRALVYRNNSAYSFYNPISLTGLWGGAPAWIDVENDGDLDLLLTGNRGDNGANILPTTLLYRYQSNTFTQVSGTGLPNLWDSSIAVGDYDNDGDYDLLLNGLTSSDRPTGIYLNNRNFTFTDAGAGLPNGTSLSAAWGDFNKDGTLDAALTGVTDGDTYTTHVYLNTNPPPPANAAPGVPTLRAACWDNNNRVTLEWHGADDEESSASLTYNLRLGSAPAAQDRFSPQSAGDGWRRVAQPGSLFGGTSATVRSLPKPGTFYWSVQAVDASYVGGAFSEQGKIDIGTRVARDNTYQMTENGILLFNILENDNQDYAPLVVHSRSSPQHGLLTALGGGLYMYLPNLQWNGTDTFNYYAIGSSLYCSQATVTINVAAVDNAPENISLSNSSILEDRPVGTPVGAFTTTDPDPEDTHTYRLVPYGSDPLDNALFQISGNQLLSNAVFDYDPLRSYTINVETRDPDGYTFTKKFTITVLENFPVSISCVSGCAGFVNLPKSAHLTMSEDGSPTPFQLTLRGSYDGPGSPLNWSSPTQPAHGTLTFATTTTPGQDLPVQYAPAADWFGSDSFVLRVLDPLGNTDQITVTVDVQAVNDAPTLDPVPDQTFLEWTGDQQIALSGIGRGAANETAQPLTITAETSDPALLRNLAVEYPGSGSTAVLRFRLEGGTGQATVTVTIRDGQPENGTRTQSFLVTVLPGQRIYFPLIFGGQE